MTEKTLTTENIRPALDALRGELAPWPVVAKKQDRLNTAQLNAANSGITSSLVAQIIANTAAIRALESAITGTGLRALVVASLPAVGTTGILYIVPVTTYDPDTDADVVNYSNEYIWIPVEGGTASEGHYEQVGQTGIVINNGQLTITVNGTSVGTFTANQSGDTTAAITVPTNADYVDRTTDQMIAGVKTFSSTIDGTASKAIADEDGTSIKTGYGKLAGNQTWTGSNTFSSITQTGTRYYRSTNNTKGTLPSSTAYYGVVNDYDSNSTVYSQTRGYISTAGTNANELTLTAWNTSDTVRVQTSISADGTTKNHTIGANTLPQTNSTYTLGTSTNKWKTLNGVNPGALSLPGNSYIDISGDITVRDGSTTNSYTAPCDGWIAIQSFATWLQISNDTLLIATTAAIGADGFAQAFLPVRKGNAVRVMINQTNTQFQSFKLLPCEGNV